MAKSEEGARIDINREYKQREKSRRDEKKKEKEERGRWRSATQPPSHTASHGVRVKDRQK